MNASDMQAPKRTPSPAQLQHYRGEGQHIIREAALISAARRRTKTHCPHGHALAGDNLYINPRGNRECRACREASSARYKTSGKIRRRLPSEKAVRAVFDALHQGRTISFITAGKITHGKNRPVEYVKGGKIIEHHVLKNFIIQNPKAGRVIERLAEKNRLQAKRSAVEHRTIARRSALSPAIIRAESENAFAAIMAATASLADFLREDVRSLMFVAHMEGRLKPRDAVKRVREFVTAHNRQFSKFVPGGGGIMRSLDEQVYDDGPTRLVDTVTHGLWQ
jgi:hypothetical protein